MVEAPDMDDGRENPVPGSRLVLAVVLRGLSGWHAPEPADAQLRLPCRTLLLLLYGTRCSKYM
jgi:hypothetical protein